MNYKLILRTEDGKFANSTDHDLLASRTNWYELMSKVYTDEQQAEMEAESTILTWLEGEVMQDTPTPMDGEYWPSPIDHLNIHVQGFIEFMGHTFLHMSEIDVHELAQGLDEIPGAADILDLYIWNNPTPNSDDELEYWIVNGDQSMIVRAGSEESDAMWVIN